MLSTNVFAGSITNLTDARYFAAWEVKWLGFQVTPGDSFTDPASEIKSISEWVDGVQLIGQLDQINQEAIDYALEVIGLNGIEFGPFNDLQSLSGLPRDFVRIQRFILEHESDLGDFPSLGRGSCCFGGLFFR